MKSTYYDRRAAAEYAEKYAETYNKDYPYYFKADCANFISQVLRAGGMKEVGTIWSKSTSWFCNTNNSKDLTNVAISWRSARYFRSHWGNEAGNGVTRAKQYFEMPVIEFLGEYHKYYKILQIGDVIQHGRYGEKYPFHTQVIHKKGYNPVTKVKDCFMAQHSVDKKYVSFYEALLNNMDGTIYIYIIA